MNEVKRAKRANALRKKTARQPVEKPAPDFGMNNRGERVP